MSYDFRFLGGKLCELVYWVKLVDLLGKWVFFWGRDCKSRPGGISEELRVKSEVWEVLPCREV